MSRAEVDAAIAAFPAACGRDLMVGVLASQKTLYGAGNSKPRRYPMPDKIAGIFPSDPFRKLPVVNLVHYAGGVATDLLDLDRVAGDRCHGFQFNGEWPAPAALKRLIEARASRDATTRLVLQLGPAILANNDLIANAARALRAYQGLATDVLLDASGGAGKGMDLFHAGWAAQEIGGRNGYAFKFGLAGGLDADSITEAVAMHLAEGFSCDAEGRLRDEAPGGGNLDLGKVAAYIAAAGRAVSGGAT